MILKYLESKEKANSFDVSIVVKIPFFLAPIGQSPSLFTVRYHELFDGSLHEKTVFPLGSPCIEKLFGIQQDEYFAKNS